MAKYEITSINETLQTSTKKPNGFYKISIGGSKGFFYIYKSDDGYWSIDYDGTKSYLTENAIIVANKLQSNLHSGKSLTNGIVYDTAQGFYTTTDKYNLGANDTLITTKSTISPSESATSSAQSPSPADNAETTFDDNFFAGVGSSSNGCESLFIRFLRWFFGF